MSTSNRPAMGPGTFERVLRGSLDKLPPEKSNVVRVFLSSGFTDFQHERNVLASEAVPQLRAYCHAKGLDLQVVDLQWGTHPEDITEPQTRDTSLREIHKCRESSLGSCFVSLIGDKYGDSPIVTSIEAKEFELLRQATQVVSKDVTLLDRWYARDQNAMPVVYVLRPVTVKFPCYNDRTEEKRAKRDQDRKDWYAVRDLLSITLRAAASHALKCSLINKTQARRYFQSALETDVTAALEVQSPSHRCLCFKRTLSDIDISDKNAGDYIDLDGGQADSEASDQLCTLTETTIPAALGKPNVHQYTVDWQPGGLDPANNAQHAQYLHSLKETFVRYVHTHVKQLLRSTSVPDCHLRDELYYDVLHHSHVCSKKIQLFIGRDKLLAEIKSKLQKVYTDAVPAQENKDSVQEDGKSGKENKDSVQEDGKSRKESKHLVLEDGKFRKEKKDSVGEDGKVDKENKDLVLENGVSGKEDENKDVVSIQLDDGEQSVTDDSLVVSDTGEGLSNDDMRECHLVVTDLSHYTKPIVLYGKSGSGKSAILSMVAQQATKWLKFEPIRVLRFLGTSEHTTCIRDVLQNLCKQIWEVFEVTERPCIQDISYLVIYVQALLRNIKTNNERPLLIILDGLDSLSSDNYAHVMNWLPVRLPEHVHLIVSVTPRRHGCLDNLQKVLPDNVCYVEVPKLLPDITNNLLKTFYKMAGRGVSETQRKMIVDLALKYAQPLYVKMLVEQSRSWRSYESIEDHVLGDTVGAIVRVLFGKLEREHGKVLVSKALGYLAIARDGVTDTQMEALLSCDDTALRSAFSQHQPPDGALIGIPPLLWQRLRQDLDLVLTERQIDCRTLVVWSCGQFAEIADKIYASDLADQVALHAAMADYYLGCWSDVAKPLELVVRRKRVNYPDARRRAQPQPIVFTGDHLNLRKLRHLAYHLTKSHRYGDIILALCRNLEWLYYRCKAFSVCDALNDFKMAADAIMADLHTPEKKGHLHKTPIIATKALVKELKIAEENEAVSDEKSNTSQSNVRIEKKTERLNGMPEMGAKMGRVWSKVSSHASRPDNGEDELDKTDREYLLRVAHTQVWQVYDMLCRVSDAVTRDVNNLPQQILGQLAGMPDLPTGLQMLYDQAEAWVQAVNIPLIVPSTKCLPTSSPDLISSVTLNLYPATDEVVDESKLWLSLDGKKLFAAERRKNGDLLKELDIENYCAVTMVQRLTHTHVNKLQVFCKDRYMLLEAHTHTEEANSSLQSVIIDQESCEPVPMPTDWKVVAVDDYGKYALVVNPSVHPPKELKKPTLVSVASLLNLVNQKRRQLRVTALKVTPRVVGGMFSLDGRHLVICGSDCKQHVFMTEVSRVSHTWESETETEAVYNDAHSMAANMHMLSRKRFLSPGMNTRVDDNVLFMRDLGVGKTLHEMRGHYYRIGIVVLNARKLLAASATTDDATVDGITGKHVHIWKLETGQLVSRCCGTEAYSRVAFCNGHDGYLLTCTTKSSVIKMWHYEAVHKKCTDAVAVYHFIGHTSSIVYLAFASDHKVLVSGSCDNTVKLWHFEDAVKRCGEALLHSKAALPLVPWEDEMGEAPNQPSEGPVVTTCAVLTKDGQNAVVGTKDGWLIFYAADTMTVIRYDRSGHDTVHSLLATSNGQHVVSTALDVVRIWDPKTGVLVRELDGTRGLGRSSCLAESQDVLAVGFGNPHHCAILWNMHTGEKMHLLHKTFGFMQVAMSRDAKLLVTDFCDQPAVFSVATGQTLPVDTDNIIATYRCTCLRISPNDRLVVTCSTNSSVKVTNLQTRIASFCLPHHSPVKEVIFTADSMTLLTAGFKNILIWSLSSGQLVTILLRHQDVINRLILTVDDKFLVSCADDRQIIVWDMSTTTSICSMSTDSAVSDVLVAPGLDCMLYVPTHVAYVAALRPNQLLQDIVRGLVPKVPRKIQHAQAFALTFSSQKVRCHTSQVCVIL